MKARKNRVQIESKQIKQSFTHSHHNPPNPLRSQARRGAVFKVAGAVRSRHSSRAPQAPQPRRVAVADLPDGVSVVLPDGAPRQAAAAAQQVPVQLHRAPHQLRPGQRGHGRARRGSAHTAHRQRHPQRPDMSSSNSTRREQGRQTERGSAAQPAETKRNPNMKWTRTRWVDGTDGGWLSLPEGVKHTVWSSLSPEDPSVMGTALCAPVFYRQTAPVTFCEYPNLCHSPQWGSYLLNQDP